MPYVGVLHRRILADIYHQFDNSRINAERLISPRLNEHYILYIAILLATKFRESSFSHLELAFVFLHKVRKFAPAINRKFPENPETFGRRRDHLAAFFRERALQRLKAESENKVCD